jgi:hypothetical protein
MIGVMPAWCLSIHRSWQCRHAGACGGAGWSIPVEAEAFETKPAEQQFLHGVRQADLLLVHLGDPRLLTESIQHAYDFSPRPVPALRRHRHPFG